MNDTVIVGDLQIKESKPYSLAMNDFIEWFTQQSYCQANNILILLGDIAENGLLTTDENDIIVNTFFKRLPFKQILICHGNHEYNKGKSSLKFLRNLSNVKVCYEPELIKIYNRQFLFLPYLNDKINNMTMKEYYMNLPDELNNDNVDYMIGHFAYKPIFENDHNFIPVDNIKANHKIIGHIHSGHLNDSQDYYLGSPLIDRYDHKGKNSYIMTISCDNQWQHQFHLVPRFIDYQTVTYPNALPEKKSNYVIWDVEDSIDKDLTIEHYTKLCTEKKEDFYWREIHSKIEENHNTFIIKSNKEDKKFSDYLNQFYVTKNINNKVQNILNQKLIKRLN
jgi:hypothetical protein